MPITRGRYKTQLQGKRHTFESSPMTDKQFSSRRRDTCRANLPARARRSVRPCRRVPKFPQTHLPSHIHLLIVVRCFAAPLGGCCHGFWTDVVVMVCKPVVLEGSFGQQPSMAALREMKDFGLKFRV